MTREKQTILIICTIGITGIMTACGQNTSQVELEIPKEIETEFRSGLYHTAKYNNDNDILLEAEEAQYDMIVQVH